MYQNIHKIRVHTEKCVNVRERGQYPKREVRVRDKGSWQLLWPVRESKVSGVVGLVSVRGDSVRTRRGELASRRKASEASRKIVGSISNVSVE
jgi:hypothetical protein